MYLSPKKKLRFFVFELCFLHDHNFGFFKIYIHHPFFSFYTIHVFSFYTIQYSTVLKTIL